MKLKTMTALILLLIISTVSFARPSVPPHARQVANSKDDEHGWSPIGSFAFPVLLAWDSIRGTSAGSGRRIFLFLEARYFTRDNLLEVFQRLALESAKGIPLEITVFSDKTMQEATQCESDKSHYRLL